MTGEFDQPQKNQNSAEGTNGDWASRMTNLIRSIVHSEKEVEVRFKPHGSSFSQLEISFEVDGEPFVGYAWVEAVESILVETGYPVDLWLTLVGRAWPTRVLSCQPTADLGVALSLELQDLILFLPFENRSEGNRPLALFFYQGIDAIDTPEALKTVADYVEPADDPTTDEDLLRGPVETEPELMIIQQTEPLNPTVVDQVEEQSDPIAAIEDLQSSLDTEDGSPISEIELEDRTRPMVMPKLRPMKTPVVRPKSQQFLTIDDDPYLTCLEITARQTNPTINEALFKRSLARSAGCEELEIVPLAMTHAIDELVILVEMPNEETLQRFLSYFAFHRAKLGNHMQVKRYIELKQPRRWVWRQLITSGTFQRAKGRLAFSTQ